MSEINTAEFMRAFDAMVQRTEQSAEQAFRAVVLDIFSNIQNRTPVDTGRLRGNWQVGFDGEQSATIYNNLPYAAVAEYGQWGTGEGATEKTTRDGYSTQAPSGMVRVTLTEFEQKLRAAAQDNKL